MLTPAERNTLRQDVRSAYEQSRSFPRSSRSNGMGIQPSAGDTAPVLMIPLNEN